MASKNGSSRRPSPSAVRPRYQRVADDLTKRIGSGRYPVGGYLPTEMELCGQYGISDVHLLMAASVVCMLPCIVLFFAMQKYFVESVAMTGLKS